MTNSLTEEFQKLPFETQKEKLIAILSQLQDDEGFFAKVLIVVEGNPNITSENLTNIYTDILEFAQDLKEIDKEREIQIKDKLKSRIKKLQEQEILERAEENPDNLLKNI